MADNTDRIDSLIEALQNKNGQTRISALEELSDMAPEAQEAVPALVQVLENPNEEEGICYAAAIVLAKIDPEAEKAIPVLINVLQDQDYENGDIRKTIVETFKDMNSAVVVPALIKAIHKRNTQYSVAYILYELNCNSSLPQQAIDVLENVLSDEANELEARWMVAVALQNTNTDLNIQKFFTDNDLEDPENAECPEHADFDIYTRKCVIRENYRSHEGFQQVIRIVVRKMRGN